MFNVLVGQIQIARVLDSECFRALFTSYYLKTKWNKDETLEKDSFQFPDDQYFNKSLINWYQKRVWLIWRYDRAIFIYFSWSYAKQLFLFLFFRAPSCQKWQWGNLLQHSAIAAARPLIIIHQHQLGEVYCIFSKPQNNQHFSTDLLWNLVQHTLKNGKLWLIVLTLNFIMIKLNEIRDLSRLKSDWNHKSLTFTWAWWLNAIERCESVFTLLRIFSPDLFVDMFEMSSAWERKKSFMFGIHFQMHGDLCKSCRIVSKYFGLCSQSHIHQPLVAQSLLHDFHFKFISGLSKFKYSMQPGMQPLRWSKPIKRLNLMPLCRAVCRPFLLRTKRISIWRKEATIVVLLGIN